MGRTPTQRNIPESVSEPKCGDETIFSVGVQAGLKVGQPGTGFETQAGGTMKVGPYKVSEPEWDEVGFSTRWGEWQC